MPLSGKQILPRDFVDLCSKHWKGYDLVKIVAVIFAESQGFVGAYNDNLDSNGNVSSRDCGVFEISIPANEIGSDVEFLYRTDSKDPNDYQPVLDRSEARAWELFNQPWQRNGVTDIRCFQPWFAYTLGWATFAHAWVWHQNADHVPIGPWQKTGRYLHKSIVGVCNWHYLVKKDKTLQESVVYGQNLAGHFKLDSIIKKHPTLDLVTFVPPIQPTDPPAKSRKDPLGAGPRPIPNDGA